MEIERKFLVKTNDWQDRCRSYHRLEQGYLAFPDENHPEVRVRLTSKPVRYPSESDPVVTAYDCAFLTVKSKGGLVRSEVESVIDVDAALDMMKLCLGDKISKTRYWVPTESGTFEVDVYHGNLEGLVTAEIELTSPDQEIVLPPWIGDEVTAVSSYKNASLAQHGLPSTTWSPSHGS